MKSILSTIIFVLVFFLSFFLHPSPALATRSNIPVCDGTKVNLNDSNGNPNNNPPYANCLMAQDRDPNDDRKECGVGETPCSNNQTLCRGANGISGPRCLPNGVTTKYPSCRSGSGTLPIFCPADLRSQSCCLKDWNGFCKTKSGGILTSCNTSELTLTPRDNCGSDGVFGYDPDTKLCFQGFESKWALNFSPCTGGEGISTAVGCIPTNGPDGLKGFLEFVLKWAFFASGGIIVLMVIATGYTLMTSQGNPEKLQAAKENIVALFSGLILIAFSLVLLQTIGADILKLPTF